MLIYQVPWNEELICNCCIITAYSLEFFLLEHEEENIPNLF